MQRNLFGVVRARFKMTVDLCRLLVSQNVQKEPCVGWIPVENRQLRKGGALRNGHRDPRCPSGPRESHPAPCLHLDCRASTGCAFLQAFGITCGSAGCSSKQAHRRGSLQTCAVLDWAHLDYVKPTYKQKVGSGVWLLHNTCSKNSGMQCIPGRTKQPLFEQYLISPVLPLTCYKQQFPRPFPGFCTERRWIFGATKFLPLAHKFNILCNEVQRDDSKSAPHDIRRNSFQCCIATPCRCCYCSFLHSQ